MRALTDYANLRDQQIPVPGTQLFFLLDGGLPLTSRKLLTAFNRLRHNLKWTARSPRPRLYDLRHTFACRRLLAWYEQGVDVHTVFPALSTYLGHVKVTDTYWYLSAVPELLTLAGERFEDSIGFLKEG
jgi:integrase